MSYQATSSGTVLKVVGRFNTLRVISLVHYETIPGVIRLVNLDSVRNVCILYWFLTSCAKPLSEIIDPTCVTHSPWRNVHRHVYQSKISHSCILGYKL